MKSLQKFFFDDVALVCQLRCVPPHTHGNLYLVAVMVRNGFNFLAQLLESVIYYGKSL